ncbi:MAG TPA: hypothetical protein VKY27_00760 [Bacteriovoracaceae bacterium]|nr:hypothetical protein [Bacteriovoracaceae bacterium]
MVRNQDGQTVVEYILLLAVAVSLIITFYNSEAFRRLFGEQGAVAQKIRQDSEFSYRHGYTRGNTGDVSRTNRDGSIHPTYYNQEKSGSRFFSGKDAYP